MSSTLPQHPFAWISGLMSQFPHPWFLCGGWAVAFWLGQQTRRHGDVDIFVFHDSQLALFDHLSNFHLVAHDPNVYEATTEPWDGRQLDLPAHIHARERAEGSLDLLHAYITRAADPGDDMNLEIMINERSGTDWFLHRNSDVALPVDRSSSTGPGGIPVAVPTALIFFKATGRGRKRDRADILALLPLLTRGEKDWLHRSISSVQPENPWLAYLGGG